MEQEGEAQPQQVGDEMSPARDRVIGWSLFAVAFALCAFVRIFFTVHDVNFDPDSPAGLLRSDQGLIYYVTERIAESGGSPPADFRADPLIRHPGTADIPAMFSVGQEFLVAWAFSALGGDVPLHVVAVWLMSLIASLAALGVFGTAYELTGRWRWAGLAALLYATMPINFRTLGMILIREDLSFPLFTLHVWLAARAARRSSTATWTASGAFLAAALATWHAMAFVVEIESATLLAWFLVRGRNPFGARGPKLVVGLVALACVIVPMLASKGFLFSPSIAIALGLTVTAWWSARASSPASPLLVRATGLGLVLAFAVAGKLVGPYLAEGAGDYGHVVAFLTAKVTHLGAKPLDPFSLPFGARLLWDGPFATAQPIEFWIGLRSGLLFLGIGFVLGLLRWFGRERESEFALVAGFGGASLIAAWLVRRTMILLGAAGPVLALWPLLRAGRGGRRGWTAFLVLTIALQGGKTLYDCNRIDNPWYAPPNQPRLTQNLRELLEWVEANVPEDEAIYADFVVSTAILAHSRHPIVTQPKYETTESRDRIEGFFMNLFQGDLSSLEEEMQRYDSRYLLLDRVFLRGSAYIGGLGPRQRSGPGPGTPAAIFLPDAPGAMPGFEPLYQGPATGRPVYRLARLAR